MDEIIVGIIFVALWIIIPPFYKKLYNAYVLSFTVQRLHWIKANMNVDFFVSLESKLVDEKYFILNQDEPYIQEIITRFIAYMEELSLRKDVPYKKEFRKVSIEEYAMCFLVSFLAKNEGDYRPEKEIAEYSMQDDMYKIYALTDYGYAYYRIYNIAVTYCNKSEKIGKYIMHFISVQGILDSGTVKYFRK